jgi:hypothetical protein
MYRSKEERWKLESNGKCICCGGDVRLQTSYVDSDYKDHICKNTNNVGWYCMDCEEVWHSPNRYGHSGNPMRCSKCGSINVSTPS